MRYKVLVEKSGKEESPDDLKSPGRTKWFSEWYTTTHVPKSTANEWWQQFADAVGLTITPSKASPEQQQPVDKKEAARMRL